VAVMASIGDGDGGVNDKVSEPLQHTNGKEVELNAELSQINQYQQMCT
jgi:hypothetical protein